MFGAGTTLKGNAATTIKLLDDLVEPHLTKMGLTIGEADVLTLVLIAAPEHPPPTQLAGWLGLTTAGITGRLNTLERKGLIERRPHATDGRRVHVHLTDSGADLAEAVMAAKNQAWNRTVIEVLGETGAAALNATLERLNDALAETTGHRATVAAT